MHCPSLDSFAGRLVFGAYTTTGGRLRRARQALPEFLKRIRVQPTISFDEQGKPRFMFGGLAERDAIAVLDDVYAILAALRQKRPAVLVLDEFQAAGDLGGGLAPALKALGDRYPEVSLVMAGSQHHLMEALVLSRGAPLYNMAERMALGPIDQQVMAAYLLDRAAHGGKPMAVEAADRICDLAGPVPYDIQRLAYEVFDQAVSTIGPAEVEAGMTAVIQREDPNFTDRFARLPLGQRRLLWAIAMRRQVDRPYAAEFAREIGYAGPPGVRRAVEALSGDETVTLRGGSLVVADPFLAEWLRRL
jgi:hypothetical protein